MDNIVVHKNTNYFPITGTRHLKYAVKSKLLQCILLYFLNKAFSVLHGFFFLFHVILKNFI